MFFDNIMYILHIITFIVEIKADTMNQIKEIALSVVVLKNEEFNASSEKITVADVHIHHAQSDDNNKTDSDLFSKGSFSSNSSSCEVSTYLIWKNIVLSKI